ncbi:MAG: response regulator [Myxococcota bacterium]|nr:response regulator [Myxococcota bacterium]
MASPRVLVVDDSLTIRKVVSSVLDRHGFEAVQAPDGKAALDLLLSPPDGVKIDLVLVDFVMPRMNGFQLCRAIRQDEQLRTTPVVLMSAKSDRIREHFVQQTGALDAITKPFDARALIAVVENAVRRSAQWRLRAEALAAGAPLDLAEERTEADELTDAGTSAPLPSTGNAYSDDALSGDMGVIPIGAVLQLLQVESKGGVLMVTDGEVEVTIALRAGLIELVSARGAGTEFRLGRYLVEHGIVSPADIDGLLGDGASASAPPPHKVLGELLLESGRVSRAQLNDALTRQSSELVYDILRWPGGRFEFRCEPLPPLAVSATLGLPVASVVMEGFRRVDEWRVVEAGLGDFASVLQKDPAAVEAVQIERLAKPEQRLLEMVDGRRTVRDIVSQSHMSSFDACKILFQLLEARLVRRRAG